MEVKPFIKWVGGKTQLIKEINQRIPKVFNNYIEPFLGGGAIFFKIKSQDKDKKGTINDLSTDLTDAYLAIKKDPEKLMLLLDKHQKNHQLNPKEYFYSIRNQDRDDQWMKQDIFVKTARLIYLNKTCFNGLYRVNKNGYFNVPWNQKTQVNLYDRQNILKINEILNHKVTILNQDFEKVVQKAEKGDFIFFDPPYDLLNKNTFDAYMKDKFGIEGQKRLSKVAHQLNDKGCYVMITNHNTPLINELYHDFKIDVVNVKRMINANAKKRTGVETIIYNY